MGISKLILQFSYYFHVPCTGLSTVFWFCNFHVSFYYSHSKANGVNLTVLSFVKDWPYITSTYKLQRLKIKNKILWVPTIISIQFQNCYFFLWDLLWSRRSLDVDKLHEKYQKWGSFYRQISRWVSATLSKMYSLASTFQGFHSDLFLSIKISRYLRKVYFP